MCEKKHVFSHATCQCGVGWGQIMNAFIERRVSVASFWASSRIAVLDGYERYEDSYAITQEFREWITCLDENPIHLEASVLKVPKSFERSFLEETNDTDEVLEI